MPLKNGVKNKNQISNGVNKGILSHGVNSHKTLKAYRSCLRSFIKYFAPRYPRELTYLKDKENENIFLNEVFKKSFIER